MMIGEKIAETILSAYDTSRPAQDPAQPKPAPSIPPYHDEL